MSFSWVEITNGQVAAGAALTTALVTALRDNVGGMGQRATGAPKIFGTPYDFQEFTTDGTWNKPSNAQTGDVVIVEIVGGGQGGGVGNGANFGGDGGAGVMIRFENIDDFGATEAVTVGAGGLAATSAGAGANGEDSTFGTDGNFNFIRAKGGNNSTTADNHGIATEDDGFLREEVSSAAGAIFGGRSFVATQTDFRSCTVFGGGGGAGCTTSAPNVAVGGFSLYHGAGGASAISPATPTAGQFPGGGGGAINTGSAVGADGAGGVVRVYCMRETD